MNELNIAPLSPEQVASAAELLASTHQALTPAPRSIASAPEQAARLIEGALSTGVGIGATQDNRLVGFLIVPQPEIGDLKRIRISDVQHAAGPQSSRLVYRALYGAAAESLARDGIFRHRILVLAEPADVVHTFFQLGFGVDQIKGIRAIAAMIAPPVGPSVDPARLDELDGLAALYVELQRFHRRSPILDAQETVAAAIREELLAAVRDESRLTLVARDGGRPVGLLEAHPDSRYIDTITIGLNVVTADYRSSGVGTRMLVEVMSRAAELGYAHIAVGWASANPVSDAFYRSRGFVPIRYELARHIDERIT